MISTLLNSTGQFGGMILYFCVWYFLMIQVYYICQQSSKDDVMPFSMHNIRRYIILIYLIIGDINFDNLVKWYHYVSSQ